MPRALSCLYYHFVWTTKSRCPCLDAGLEKIIDVVARQVAKDFHAQVVIINGSLDHRHLLARLPAAVCPAKFIKNIKGISSRQINQCRGPSSFQWQEGYSVGSVSEQALPAVRAYIANQKRHHARPGTSSSERVYR